MPKLSNLPPFNVSCSTPFLFYHQSLRHSRHKQHHRCINRFRLRFRLHPRRPATINLRSALFPFPFIKMLDQSANNKRIAKNTFLLYVRMLFDMLVSLYTSRVIWNTLGVGNYGTICWGDIFSYCYSQSQR